MSVFERMSSKINVIGKNYIALGIEGGGTHTVAVWADPSGREIQRKEFGCGNVRLLNDKELISLLTQIRESGHNIPIPVHSICAGMAGAVNDADKERVKKAIISVFGTVYTAVCSDLQTPLYAAEIPEGSFPVLVLSGTGSCCYTESPDGLHTYKSGGWGHLLGDRGSAYQIGIRSLRTCLTLLDTTGELPVLGQRLLAFQLLNSPEDWINWSLKAAKSDIARLSQITGECAANGCPVSLKILKGCAAELAADALACCGNYRKENKEASPVFLLSGGLLKKSEIYQRLVSEEITREIPQAKITPLETESVHGAVKKALALLGGSVHLQDAFSDNNVIQPSPAASSVTEQRNPRSMHLSELSVADAVQLMIDEEQYITQAIQTQKEAIVRLVEVVSNAFKNGGRLFYAGAGTSGRLGVLDASECPPTFGVNPEQVQGIIAGGYEALWRASEGAEDSPQSGEGAAISRGITKRDVVIGIAASGTTPFVQGVLSRSKRIGAFTTLLCFNPNRKPYPENEPDMVLAVPTGPEILTGSTRLKSGTATKVILNIITTLSMVQIGKVMSNLMIDVRATNVKLRDRAIRIFCQLIDCSREEAQAALEANEWNIRRGIQALKKAR